MVQRYDLVSGYMQKWPEGNWVEYEDYAELKAMYDALSEKWLEVNGQHGALCDACISYGLEPTDMIENELAK